MTTKSKKIPYTKTFTKYRTLAIEVNDSLQKNKKLNFCIDGREHYVYRVTDYTRTEKQHYYGSHTPSKNKKYKSLIDEFWTYRTSSKKNVLNEDTKKNYKVKILKVFDNAADKCVYEAFLHQYFDVKRSKSFWNESNQTPFGFDTTGKVSWNKGISPTLNSKNKRKNAVNMIDPETGLTIARLIGMKSARTRSKIDPETGLTINQINGSKLKEVLNTINPETGFTPAQISTQKMSKTRSEIDTETGLTINQISGIKGAKTRSKIDPETGLTINQISGIKGAKTRSKIDPETGLSIYQMNGKKQSKTLQSVNPKTGLTLAKEYGRSRLKYYDLYHIEKGIIKSNIGSNDFPFLPSKNSKNNCYGKSIQARNAMKDENKKYIGCYVVRK